jgi:hypothetical protein
VPYNEYIGPAGQVQRAAAKDGAGPVPGQGRWWPDGDEAGMPSTPRYRDPGMQGFIGIQGSKGIQGSVGIHPPRTGPSVESLGLDGVGW